MTTTYSNNLISPEVFAKAVKASVNGNLVFRNFATTFDELERAPGDTISLVEFARLTELTSDQDETVALTPEQMTASSNSIAIREAAKAVEVSWQSKKTAFGNPTETARSETARVIARRVDSVLRDAAYSSATLEDASSAAISYNAVIDALAPYGDAIGSDEGVSLVVNSKQWRDLVKDANFQRANRNESNGNAGYVGTLDNAIPVYMSDLIEEVSGTPNNYRALLFHGKPLALATKREVETFTDDDILARTTTVSSTLLYAAGTMRPERVVELKTQ